MNRNTLIVFAAITLTVVIAAFVVVSQERSPTYLSKEPLLPTLVENINKAASISLISNHERTILERDGETWRIANSDDYPALFDKVRTLLIDLSELRTLERKTSNPELYHRLDVRDPSEPNSKSVQVTVMDDAGEALADIIVGKPRVSKVTNIQTGVYVRRPENAHAVLAEGSVPVSAEKTAWFNPDILNLPSETIREVTIEQADGSTLRAYRDSPEGQFNLADLPVNRQVQSRTALNRFGSVLQEISASDIRALETFDFPDTSTRTTVRSFDGAVIRIHSTQLDDRYYANFEFSYDASAATEAPSAEAQPVPADDDAITPVPVPTEDRMTDLQNRLGNWVYQIPEFKYKLLTAALDDYTRVAD